MTKKDSKILIRNIAKKDGKRIFFYDIKCKLFSIIQHSSLNHAYIYSKFVRCKMNRSKRQQIRACKFQMEVTQGTGIIRFPCVCYLEWKTNNGKDVFKSQNRVKLIQGKLAFDEKLMLTTHLIYDLTLQSYTKKQSKVILNLLSKSSPNEPKLVGQVTIQLSTVANGINFIQIKQYPLQFCSIDATLTFKVIMKDFQQTNLALSDLEKSEYSELQPVASEKITGRQDTKSESGPRNISSVNVGHSTINKINREQIMQKSSESNFQDRINRLKSENQQLSKTKLPEGYSSKFKREMESINASLGTSRQQRIKQYNEQRQSKRLSSDLSVPVLAKNSDEFDSNKVSEKTIKDRENSEKQILLNESPSKNSIKIIKDSSQIAQEQFHSIRNNQLSQKLVEVNSTLLKYEQQITSLKGNIEQLTAENGNYLKQLQSKNREIANLTEENTQYRQNNLKITNELTIKNQQLIAISQLNYPGLIQQLNRSIQQKDRELQSLITTTFETEKVFQGKEAQYRAQLQYLENHIKSLEGGLHQTDNKQPSQQTSPVKSQKSNKNGILTSQIQICKSRIEDLTYKLQIQQKNHENAKIQLSQLRQWYRQIQEQSQGLSNENQDLGKSLKGQIEKSEKLQQIIKSLHQQRSSNNVISNLLQEKQAKISLLDQQLKLIKEEMNLCKLNNQELTQKNRILSQQVQKSRKELDDLQSKYVEQQQHLKIAEAKLKQVTNISDKNKAQLLANVNTTRRKTEELEDAQRKLTDLIKRIKQKQENILKLQRDSEQLQSKLKFTQSNYEKVKERVKVLQNEKNNDQQKIKSLEKENRLLKSRTERDQDSLNKQINKLKQNLQNENSKKKQLSNMLNEVQNKSKQNENYKIKELQKKINKYVQKQQLLKCQLSLLEQQSNRISDVLQEKQENQQKFTQTFTILTQQNTLLKAKISQLQNQCELLNQRNQGLQSEIELLNAYQPQESENNEIGDLNKKLIEKNKDLLHQIQEKNLLIAQFQKTEGQLRGKQVQQMLSTSRIQKERQEYEERYQQLVDENEKLYKQFERLNYKYKEQISQNTQTSEQKIQSLQIKIEEFFGKLTEKDVAYAELQMKAKQDLEKLQEIFHEKQYQIQYYSNEVKELNGNIQVFNDQIGQKQFQLHLAQQKIRQLYQKITSLQMLIQTPTPVLPPQIIVNKNEALQEELEHMKSKIQFYEAEIERLHEKQFMQQKQIITIKEELTKFKENGQEEFKHIAYLEGQLKNFRQRQSQYIQQIDNLQDSESLFKSKYTRLQKDKNQLSNEIQKLNEQIQTLKQQKTQKSQQGTPISKFKESPSPLKPSVDLTDIVSQISIILNRRKQQEELQNALRLVIDNNAKQEEQFERWSRERGLIQEKAKLASKQIQKIKSSIMKTANKPISEKTQLTNLLKPAQTIINELINISQHLIQLDPYEDQDQQFEKNEENN